MFFLPASTLIRNGFLNLVFPLRRDAGNRRFHLFGLVLAGFSLATVQLSELLGFDVLQLL